MSFDKNRPARVAGGSHTGMRPPRANLGRKTSRRLSIVVTGIAGSVFLHTLLFIPLVLGYGDPSHLQQPDAQGTSARRQKEPSTDSMTAVFVEDDRGSTTTRPDDAPAVRFHLPRPVLRPVAVTRVSVAHLNLLQDKNQRPPVEASGDQAGQSVMFGRYMGQISARVERAWSRPRTIPADGTFACRVQITQDRSGNVEEVMLQKCTEDPSWRVSLMRAIASASPLPAPPDDAVFSDTVILEFDSDPYVVGGSELGFEPVRLAAAPVEVSPRTMPSETVSSNAVDSVSQAGTQGGTVTRRLRPDGSMDLTIIGNRVAPEPSR